MKKYLEYCARSQFGGQMFGLICKVLIIVKCACISKCVSLSHSLSAWCLQSSQRLGSITVQSVSYCKLWLFLSALYSKCLIIAESYSFYEWHQRDWEWVSHCLCMLKRLAAKCNFGAYLYWALRDQFVVCFHSQEVGKSSLFINWARYFDSIIQKLQDNGSCSKWDGIIQHISGIWKERCNMSPIQALFIVEVQPHQGSLYCEKFPHHVLHWWH